MAICASPPLECTRADSAEQVRDRVGATNSVESEVGAKWWEPGIMQGDFDFGGTVGNHCIRTVTASSQDWLAVGEATGARAGSVHQALDGRERDRRRLVTHGASAVTFVSRFGGLLGHEVAGHVVR